MLRLTKKLNVCCMETPHYTTEKHRYLLASSGLKLYSPKIQKQELISGINDEESPPQFQKKKKKTRIPAATDNVPAISLLHTRRIAVFTAVEGTVSHGYVVRLANSVSLLSPRCGEAIGHGGGAARRRFAPRLPVRLLCVRARSTGGSAAAAAWPISGALLYASYSAKADRASSFPAGPLLGRRCAATAAASVAARKAVFRPRTCLNLFYTCARTCAGAALRCFPLRSILSFPFTRVLPGTFAAMPLH